MKISSVVGARPNFMKIAPFVKAIEKYNLSQNGNSDGKIEHILVHTGQHYDTRMSQSFFQSLGIPNPDINLGIGSGSHAEQVGKTMIAFEKVIKDFRPDWVVVVGDVNAAIACAITAKKEHVHCCHIEAGLRSRDLTMPEEINRMVTDRISDLLLTPDVLSMENLIDEGVDKHQIHFVGNIMIDTLEKQRKCAEKLNVKDIVEQNFIDASRSQNQFITRNYAIITLHRPSNVDKKETLEPFINFILDEVTNHLSVIWPIHPRTKQRLISFDLWGRLISTKNLFLLHPLGYDELLKLNMGAEIMMTDSGGLQEECAVLGTPCLTLRWNTERPITLEKHGGVCVLVGNDISCIREGFHNMKNTQRKPTAPELWDGQTADRCLKAILHFNDQGHMHSLKNNYLE